MSTETTDPGNKSPEQIEAEVEATRARVSHTLDEIQDRMAPGEIFEQAVTFARENGAADMARNLGRQVRDNPLPLTLVGAGLAWLAFSSGQPKTRTVYRDRYVGGRDYDADAEVYYGGDAYADSYAADTGYYPGSRSEALAVGADRSPSIGDRARGYADAAAGAASGTIHALSESGQAGTSRAAHGASSAASSAASGIAGTGRAIGSGLSSGAHTATDSAARAAQGARRAGYDAATGLSSAASSAAGGVAGAGRSAASGASSAASYAVGGIAGAAGTITDALGNVVETVSDYAHSAYESVTDGAAMAYDRVSGGARYAGDRLSQSGRRGYYVMTANGRRWVDDARYGARSYGSNAGRYASQAGGILRDNPLLLGALGIAIGAAIGAALPKTRIEDEYFGETADAYKRQAWETGQDTFEEAKSKVLAIGQRAYDDAMGEARRQGLTPAEAEGKARAAGDAARAEAERVGGLARQGAAQAGSAARSGIAQAGDMARSGIKEGVSKVESVLDAAISGAKDEAEKQHVTPSDVPTDKTAKSA